MGQPLYLCQPHDILCRHFQCRKHTSKSIECRSPDVTRLSPQFPWFAEVISLCRITWTHLKVVSIKRCRPKINKLSLRYCQGGVSVSFMTVSHSYMIQSASSENLTNSTTVTILFSHSQLILHIHMSEKAWMTCLFFKHSSYMRRFKNSTQMKNTQTIRLIALYRY